MKKYGCVYEISQIEGDKDFEEYVEMAKHIAKYAAKTDYGYEGDIDLRAELTYTQIKMRRFWFIPMFNNFFTEYKMIPFTKIIVSWEM
jgi:hypothetical protein